MRLEGIMQAHRLSIETSRVLAARPVNDNLTFAERVKAEIAEAARAVGVFYTERELLRFAADASEAVNLLRRRL